MRVVKTASGENQIHMSKSEWKSIGKTAGWITARTEEIYLLDAGVLYDEDAEEVFNMKRLIKYFNAMKEMGVTAIPKFRDAEEANAFLEGIEQATGDSLGRVLGAEEDPRKTIRYKDTRDEKNKARMESLQERKEEWEKGNI
jgi:hypothetical protein